MVKAVEMLDTVRVESTKKADLLFGILVVLGALCGAVAFMSDRAQFFHSF